MQKIIDEIAAERRRQIEAEGWTAAHDDEQPDGTLAQAGACYALAATLDRADRAVIDNGGRPAAGYWLMKLWPWADEWWKPKDRRRDLIRAAALIVAEIERLDRVDAAFDGMTMAPR